MSGTNPVAAWLQTASTGGGVQDPTTYKGAIDGDFAVATRVADMFAPRPAATPAMSVVIDAGFIASFGAGNLQSVTEVAQQTVTIAAAPSSPNNRIDLVAVNATSGVASVIEGVAASSPTAPAITSGLLQVAHVSVPHGTTAISNSNITDLRAVWQSSGGAGSSDGIVGSLPNWYRGGIAGKKMRLLGDSTTSNATSAFTELAWHQNPGEALSGTIVENYGNNGATLAAILGNVPAYGIEQTISSGLMVTYTTNPSPSDTITLGGTAVTFVASGATGNQVNISSGSLSGTLTAMATFLNASSDAQISKCTYLANGNAGTTLEMWTKVTGPAGAGFTCAATTSGTTLSTAATTVPNLVVLSAGVNDVRGGAISLAQMIALLTEAVTAIQAALPNCDIVLRTPFAFLSNDPGSTGYVTFTNPPYANLAAAAQAYSNILYEAYQAMIGLWGNVVVFDCQSLICGQTCLNSAIALWMADILHPGYTGQVLWAQYLAMYFGQGVPGNVFNRPSPYGETGGDTPTISLNPVQSLAPPVSPTASDLAIACNPAQPWLIYPRILEDPRYFKRITGGRITAAATIGQGYIRFVTDDPADIISMGDVVQLGRAGVMQLPSGYFGASKYVSFETQLASLGGSNPPVAGNYTVNVYRPLYGDSTFAVDMQLLAYLNDTIGYPYRRQVYGAGSGTNYLRLNPYLADQQFKDEWTPDSADVVIFPGFTTCAATAGGTGQAVNDVLTLADGSTVKVLTISGSAAATVQLLTQPTIPYTYPAAQTATTGSGTGFTGTLSNTPIALGSAAFYLLSLGAYQFAPTGSWGALAGRVGWVFGLGTKNRMAQEASFEPIHWWGYGSITGTVTQYQTVSRAGYCQRLSVNLGTASSSGAITYEMSINGTLALTVTWNQGVSGQSPSTVTWNSSGYSSRCTTTGCYFRPGDLLTHAITAAGSGGADMAVSIDL